MAKSNKFMRENSIPKEIKLIEEMPLNDINPSKKFLQANITKSKARISGQSHKANRQQQQSMQSNRAIQNKIVPFEEQNPSKSSYKIVSKLAMTMYFQKSISSESVCSIIDNLPDSKKIICTVEQFKQCFLQIYPSADNQLISQVLNILPQEEDKVKLKGFFNLLMTSLKNAEHMLSLMDEIHEGYIHGSNFLKLIKEHEASEMSDTITIKQMESALYKHGIVPELKMIESLVLFDFDRNGRFYHKEFLEELGNYFIKKKKDFEILLNLPENLVESFLALYKEATARGLNLIVDLTKSQLANNVKTARDVENLLLKISKKYDIKALYDYCNESSKYFTNNGAFDKIKFVEKSTKLKGLQNIMIAGQKELFKFNENQVQLILKTIYGIIRQNGMTIESFFNNTDKKNVGYIKLEDFATSIRKLQSSNNLTGKQIAEAFRYIVKETQSLFAVFVNFTNTFKTFQSQESSKIIQDIIAPLTKKSQSLIQRIQVFPLQNDQIEYIFFISAMLTSPNIKEESVKVLLAFLEIRPSASGLLDYRNGIQIMKNFVIQEKILDNATIAHVFSDSPKSLPEVHQGIAKMLQREIIDVLKVKNKIDIIAAFKSIANSASFIKLPDFSLAMQQRYRVDSTPELISNYFNYLSNQQAELCLYDMLEKLGPAVQGNQVLTNQIRQTSRQPDKVQQKAVELTYSNMNAFKSQKEHRGSMITNNNEIFNRLTENKLYKINENKLSKINEDNISQPGELNLQGEFSQSLILAKKRKITYNFKGASPQIQNAAPLIEEICFYLKEHKMPFTELYEKIQINWNLSTTAQFFKNLNLNMAIKDLTTILNDFINRQGVFQKELFAQAYYFFEKQIRLSFDNESKINVTTNEEAKLSKRNNEIYIPPSLNKEIINVSDKVKEITENSEGEEENSFDSVDLNKDQVNRRKMSEIKKEEKKEKEEEKKKEDKDISKKLDESGDDLEVPKEKQESEEKQSFFSNFFNKYKQKKMQQLQQNNQNNQDNIDINPFDQVRGAVESAISWIASSFQTKKDKIKDAQKWLTLIIDFAKKENITVARMLHEIDINADGKTNIQDLKNYFKIEEVPQEFFTFLEKNYADINGAIFLSFLEDDLNNLLANGELSEEAHIVKRSGSEIPKDLLRFCETLVKNRISLKSVFYAFPHENKKISNYHLQTCFLSFGCEKNKIDEILKYLKQGNDPYYDIDKIVGQIASMLKNYDTSILFAPRKDIKNIPQLVGRKTLDDLPLHRKILDYFKIKNKEGIIDFYQKILANDNFEMHSSFDYKAFKLSLTSQYRDLTEDTIQKYFEYLALDGFTLNLYSVLDKLGIEFEIPREIEDEALWNFVGWIKQEYTKISEFYEHIQKDKQITRSSFLQNTNNSIVKANHVFDANVIYLIYKNLFPIGKSIITFQEFEKALNEILFLSVEMIFDNLIQLIPKNVQFVEFIRNRIYAFPSTELWIKKTHVIAALTTINETIQETDIAYAIDVLSLIDMNEIKENKWINPQIQLNRIAERLEYNIDNQKWDDDITNNNFFYKPNNFEDNEMIKQILALIDCHEPKNITYFFDKNLVKADKYYATLHEWIAYFESEIGEYNATKYFEFLTDKRKKLCCYDLLYKLGSHIKYDLRFFDKIADKLIQNKIDLNIALKEAAIAIKDKEEELKEDSVEEENSDLSNKDEEDELDDDVVVNFIQNLFPDMSNENITFNLTQIANLEDDDEDDLYISKTVLKAHLIKAVIYNVNVYPEQESDMYWKDIKCIIDIIAMNPDVKPDKLDFQNTLRYIRTLDDQIETSEIKKFFQTFCQLNSDCINKDEFNEYIDIRFDYLQLRTNYKNHLLRWQSVSLPDPLFAKILKTIGVDVDDGKFIFTKFVKFMYYFYEKYSVFILKFFFDTVNVGHQRAISLKNFEVLDNEKARLNLKLPFIKWADNIFGDIYWMLYLEDENFNNYFYEKKMTMTDFKIKLSSIGLMASMEELDELIELFYNKFTSEVDVEMFKKVFEHYVSERLMSITDFLDFHVSNVITLKQNKLIQGFGIHNILSSDSDALYFLNKKGIGLFQDFELFAVIKFLEKLFPAMKAQEFIEIVKESKWFFVFKKSMVDLSKRMKARKNVRDKTQLPISEGKDPLQFFNLGEEKEENLIESDIEIESDQDNNISLLEFEDLEDDKKLKEIKEQLKAKLKNQKSKLIEALKFYKTNAKNDAMTRDTFTKFLKMLDSTIPIKTINKLFLDTIIITDEEPNNLVLKGHDNSKKRRSHVKSNINIGASELTKVSSLFEELFDIDISINKIRHLNSIGNTFIIHKFATDDDLYEYFLVPSKPRLEFIECHEITNEGYELLFNDNDCNLISLKIWRCVGFDDIALEGLINSMNMDKLIELELSFLYDFTPKTINMLMKANMPMLQKLTLREFGSLSDQIFQDNRNLPEKLVELDLSYNAGIGNKTLEVISQSNSMRNLKVLKMKRCGKIDSKGILYLISSVVIKELKHLNIKNNAGIGAPALIDMIDSEFFRNLQKFMFKGCGETNDVYQHIINEKFPNNLIYFRIPLEINLLHNLLESNFFSHIKRLKIDNNEFFTITMFEHVSRIMNKYQEKLYHLEDLYLPSQITCSISNTEFWSKSTLRTYIKSIPQVKKIKKKFKYSDEAKQDENQHSSHGVFIGNEEDLSNPVDLNYFSKLFLKLNPNKIPQNSSYHIMKFFRHYFTNLTHFWIDSEFFPIPEHTFMCANLEKLTYLRISNNKNNLPLFLKAICLASPTSNLKQIIIESSLNEINLNFVLNLPCLKTVEILKLKGLDIDANATIPFDNKRLENLKKVKLTGHGSFFLLLQLSTLPNLKEISLKKFGFYSSVTREPKILPDLSQFYDFQGLVKMDPEFTEFLGYCDHLNDGSIADFPLIKYDSQLSLGFSKISFSDFPNFKIITRDLESITNQTLVQSLLTVAPRNCSVIIKSKFLMNKSQYDFRNVQVLRIDNQDALPSLAEFELSNLKKLKKFELLLCNQNEEINSKKLELKDLKMLLYSFDYALHTFKIHCSFLQLVLETLTFAWANLVQLHLVSTDPLKADIFDSIWMNHEKFTSLSYMFFNYTSYHEIPFSKLEFRFKSIHKDFPKLTHFGLIKSNNNFMLDRMQIMNKDPIDVTRKDEKKKSKGEEYNIEEITNLIENTHIKNFEYFYVDSITNILNQNQALDIVKIMDKVIKLNCTSRIYYWLIRWLMNIFYQWLSDPLIQGNTQAPTFNPSNITPGNFDRNNFQSSNNNLLRVPVQSQQQQQQLQLEPSPNIINLRFRNNTQNLNSSFLISNTMIRPNINNMQQNLDIPMSFNYNNSNNNQMPSRFSQQQQIEANIGNTTTGGQLVQQQVLTYLLETGNWKYIWYYCERITNPTFMNEILREGKFESIYFTPDDFANYFNKVLRSKSGLIINGDIRNKVLLSYLSKHNFEIVTIQQTLKFMNMFKNIIPKFNVDELKSFAKLNFNTISQIHTDEKQKENFINLLFLHPLFNDKEKSWMPQDYGINYEDLNGVVIWNTYTINSDDILKRNLDLSKVIKLVVDCKNLRILNSKGDLIEKIAKSAKDLSIYNGKGCLKYYRNLIQQAEILRIHNAKNENYAEFENICAMETKKLKFLEIKFWTGIQGTIPENPLPLTVARLSIDFLTLFETNLMINRKLDCTSLRILGPTSATDLIKKYPLLELISQIPSLTTLILKDISFNLDSLIPFLESDCLKKLKHLEIDIPSLKNEFLDLLANAKNLSNLTKLKILSTKGDKLLTQHAFFDLTEGVNAILESTQLINMNWEYFFNHNTYLLNDETINTAIHLNLFKNVKKLKLLKSKLTEKGVIKILQAVNPDIFDLESFLNLHKNQDFTTVNVYLQYFNDKFRGKLNNLVFFDIRYALHTKLLDFLHQKTITQSNVDNFLYNDNLINGTNYDHHIDDNLIEILCKFSSLIKAKKIIISHLSPKKHCKITTKGINQFVQEFPYDTIPNLYLWIILDPQWRNLANAEILFKISWNIKSYEFYDLRLLNLSGHLYLSGRHIINDKEKFGRRSLFVDTSLIAKTIFQLIEKLPYITNLILDNLNLDDDFCRKLSIFFATKLSNRQHRIKFLSIANNPHVTFVGMKFLYTICIKDDTLKYLNAFSQEQVEETNIILLNNGLDSALKHKFNQYKRNIRNLGCTYYDHWCIPLILYFIICCPFATEQLFRDEIRTNRTARACQDYLENIWDGAKRLFRLQREQIKYKYFSLTDNDAGPNRDEFIFTKSCIQLDETLGSRILWTFYSVNSIGFYFLCLFLPIYFIMQCGQGHRWASHYIYAIYAGAIAVIETFLLIFMVNKIGDKNVAVFRFGDLIPLALSQIAKLSLYTDMLYLTIVMTCGNYVLGILSMISLILYVGIALIQILVILKEYKTTNDTHSSTYINLIAKFSYVAELRSIAVLLERIATSCAIKMGRYYIPQVMVTSFLKFVLQNVPHAILELYSIITGSSNKDNEAIYIASFIFTVISMIISFYAAIKVQPSICTAKMLKQLSYINYKRNLRALQPHEIKQELQEKKNQSKSSNKTERQKEFTNRRSGGITSGLPRTKTLINQTKFGLDDSFLSIEGSDTENYVEIEESVSFWDSQHNMINQSGSPN